MPEVFNRTQLRSRRKGLRKILPKAEILLWQRLRNRKLEGKKFRRQYSIGSFIVDFYCPELKLAIEIDGENHRRKKSVIYDKMRQRKIESYHTKLIRFTNEEVPSNLENVLEKITRVMIS